MTAFSEYYVTADKYVNNQGELDMCSFEKLLKVVVKLETQFIKNRKKEVEDNSETDETMQTQDLDFLQKLLGFYADDAEAARSFYYQEKLQLDTKKKEDLQ